MNSNPSRLSSRTPTLVLDASVLINLLGTEQPEIVLRTLKREVIVEEMTLAEVCLDPITGRSADQILASLRADNLLGVAQMSNAAYEYFLALTGAIPPDDLDDGEAATIAHAIDIRAAAVIDERKAVRVAAMFRRELPVLASMDLFSSTELVNGLAADHLADVVFSALRNSRMRVPPIFRGWLVELLGEPRVAECRSLNASFVRSATKGGRG